MSEIQTYPPPNEALPAPESEEDQRQRQIAQNQAAIQLLQSWRKGDAAEVQRQREVWEYLKRVLDEDRLSDRKLFLCDES